MSGDDGNNTTGLITFYERLIVVFVCFFIGPPVGFLTFMILEVGMPGSHANFIDIALFLAYLFGGGQALLTGLIYGFACNGRPAIWVGLLAGAGTFLLFAAFGGVSLWVKPLRGGPINPEALSEAMWLFFTVHLVAAVVSQQIARLTTWMLSR